MTKTEFKAKVKSLIMEDLGSTKVSIVVQTEKLNDYLGEYLPRHQNFWAVRTENKGVVIILDSPTMDIHFSLEEFLEDIMMDFYTEVFGI